MRSHYLVLLLAVMCPGLRADAQPVDERAVLLELFNATNGRAWKNNDGWNTDAPFCKWYGVWCDYLDGDEDQPVVARLSLFENNLSGTLPPSLARLQHLKSLSIHLNQLRGDFPADLLHRWDNHQLDLHWGGNSFRQQLTAVSLTQTAGGVLCSSTDDVHFSFNVVGHRATMQSVRCGDNKPDATYCLVRDGVILGLDRLARALTELNVQSIEREYTYPSGMMPTHSSTLTTGWTWGDGSTKGLSTYGGQGPLRAWMAQQLTLALLADASWERTIKKSKCDFER